MLKDPAEILVIMKSEQEYTKEGACSKTSSFSIAEELLKGN
jgi:hypothetical protein